MLFRHFSSTIFTPSDSIIDVGERPKDKYRGSLVVVPTPLGNLNDMSLRQFEALTSYADIIACEDTRKTGKMLELLLDKQMKSKFKSAFGTDFDTFFDTDVNVKEDPVIKPEKN